MKIALLPYKQNNTSSADDDNREKAEIVVEKLVQYVGEIPLDAKVVTDHYSTSRIIALYFEAKYHTETTIYPWLNPGARKRTNALQFEHLINSLMTLNVPMLILIVSATFIGTYSQQVIDLLEIPTDRNVKGIGAGGILVIDPNSKEKLKVISI